MHFLGNPFKLLLDDILIRTILCAFYEAMYVNFFVYMPRKHAMLCHVMSCYKLLCTFDWFVMKCLMIFLAQIIPCSY